MDYSLNDGKNSVKADMMIFDIDDSLKVMSDSKSKMYKN